MADKLKRTKLYLLLLLIVTLLSITGCTNDNDTSSTKDTALVENETDSSKEVGSESTPSLFTFSLYDSDRVFSKEDLSTQQAFEDFLHELFTDTYVANSISINFMMEHPENYNITPVASAWPTIDYNDMESYESQTKNYQDRLKSFDISCLTYEQQLIYDTLTTYFETDLSCPDAYLFSSPFSLNGLPSELPLIFTEYSFSDTSDVEDYLTLLETLNTYVQSQLDFEKYRMEKGYRLSAYSYRSAISQCQNFLDQGDDYLITIFSNKLNDMENISDDVKSSYIERNKAAIEKVVIPAYHLMISTLTEYEKQGTNEKGLCDMEGGDSYYSYLLKNNVGTSKTPEELIALVEEKIASYQTQLSVLVSTHPTILSQIENPKYLYTDPDDILTYLTNMLESDFPKPASTSYVLKDIDAAMADELSVAFYILSPLDNYDNNIIYVNPNRVSAGNDLFPTLAHEGLPGHMYQHDYYCSLNPHYFRNLLSFTGYSEAWAEYVELYSFNWSGLDENVAKALQLNLLFSDALPTRIDLGVNYQGWTVKDTADYLNSLGIDGSEYAQTYYDTSISAPTIFFTYYLGYLELMDLQTTVKKQLGDKFNLQDFHKFYLEIGPTYFDIIESRISDWAEKINNK